MHVTPIKAIAVGLWISTLSAVGLIGGLGSFSGWLLLATVAIVSPLALMRLGAPRQPASERILAVLR